MKFTFIYLFKTEKEPALQTIFFSEKKWFAFF